MYKNEDMLHRRLPSVVSVRAMVDVKIDEEEELEMGKRDYKIMHSSYAAYGIEFDHISTRSPWIALSPCRHLAIVGRLRASTPCPPRSSVYTLTSLQPTQIAHGGV